MILDEDLCKAQNPFLERPRTNSFWFPEIAAAIEKNENRLLYDSEGQYRTCHILPGLEVF